MIIDCIADLHGYYPKLEGGDLLIVAGDLTARHSISELDDFNEWMREQEYRKKILIAGNHDTFFESGVYNCDNPIDGTVFVDPSIEYLCDSGTEFEGLKIWGSPWSLSFPGINPKCCAFTGDEKKLFDSYDKIPKGIDILITHCPPFGILDKCKKRHVGSRSLYGWLKYVERPRLHVFGHIHEGYGQEEFFSTYNDEMMLSVNCSVVNENYEHLNEPIRVVL